MSSREIHYSVGGLNLALVFSLRAMVALRERWGLRTDAEVSDRLASLQDGVTVEVVVDLLYASTRTHHRDITWDTLFDAMDSEGLESVRGFIPVLENLISASTPKIPKSARPPQAAADQNAH